MPKSPASFECSDEDFVLDMVFIRRFFTLLMTSVFDDNSNYGPQHKELECYSISAGNLSITLDGVYDPAEKTEYKPSVNVGFGDIQFGKPSVNYDNGATEDMSGRFYTATARLPIKIQHITPHADASYQLAFLSLDAFFGLKEWIRERLRLRGVSIAQISRPQKLKSSPDDYFTVDLSGMLEFDYTVKSSIQSHRIKKFVLDDLI